MQESGGHQLYGEASEGSQDRQGIGSSIENPDIGIDDSISWRGSSVDGHLINAGDDVKIAGIVHVIQIRNNKAAI